MDKKVIHTLLSLFLSLSAYVCNAGQPSVLMRTSRAFGLPITITLRSPDKSTVGVDWGDGVISEYQVSSENTKVGGIVSGPEIKIYSREISFLDCSECDLLALDVTHAVSLQQLYCAKNFLESLDLTANTSLQMFGCPGNRLSYLNIRNCYRLKGLFLQNNRFGAVDLNEIFNVLQYRETKSSNINLRITGNPGTRTCNSSVVQKKNWTVDVNGDNSSGNPVLLETLLPDGTEVILVLRNMRASQARIDWGNGPVRVNLSSKSTRVKGRVYGNCVKIWSDALVFLSCERMALCDIDISGAVNLQQVYCGYNELETIDVSHNPNLTRIGIPDNHIKMLDLSNNQKLTGLYMQNNLFKAKAINNVLRQLPSRKNMEEKVNLRVRGNPGESKADCSLARSKNWKIDIDE